MKHNFYSSRRRVGLAAAIFFTAAGLSSCNDSTSPNGGTPAAVAAQTTPSPTTIAGVGIPGPSVVVTASDGTPVEGVQVQFDVTGGGGAVEFPVATTDAQGVASSGVWQIGQAGENTVTATVSGLQPVSFSTTASIGVPGTVQIIAGNNQIAAQTNSVLAEPLTVQVVNAGGFPVADAPVTFTVTAGGGTIAGGSTVTNEFGFATSGPWTVGSTFVPQIVVAQSSSATATFKALIDPCKDPARAATATPIAVGETVNGSLSATACSSYMLTTTANEGVKITLTSTGFDGELLVSNATGSRPVATATGTGTSTIRLVAAAGDHVVDVFGPTPGLTGDFTLQVEDISTAQDDCSGVTFQWFAEVGTSAHEELTKTDASACSPLPQESWLVWLPADATVIFDATQDVLNDPDFGVKPDMELIVWSPTGAIDYNNIAGSALIEYNPGFDSPSKRSLTAPTSGFYRVMGTAWSWYAHYNYPNGYGDEVGGYTFSTTAVSGF
jgi:hypothetical protein